MRKAAVILFLASALLPGQAPANVTLEAVGAAELRSGNLNYEEYYFSGFLGLGGKIERYFEAKEKPGLYLEVGSAFIISELEGQELADQRDSWAHLEMDPRMLLRLGGSYKRWAPWVFVETRYSYDRAVGLDRATDNFMGAGLALNLVNHF